MNQVNKSTRYHFWQSRKFYKLIKIKQNKKKSGGKRLDLAKIFFALRACNASEQKNSLREKPESQKVITKQES